MATPGFLNHKRREHLMSQSKNGFSEEMVADTLAYCDRTSRELNTTTAAHHQDMRSLAASLFTASITMQRRAAALMVICQRQEGVPAFRIDVLDAHFKAFHDPFALELFEGDGLAVPKHLRDTVPLTKQQGELPAFPALKPPANLN